MPAKPLTFIQAKVNDGILSSFETAKNKDNLQSHINGFFLKKKLVAKETAENLADVQDYLVDSLAEKEQYAEEKPNLMNIKEIDLSKDEGALETSINYLKIEWIFKKLDAQYVKSQIGWLLTVYKILLFIYR